MSGEGGGAAVDVGAEESGEEVEAWVSDPELGRVDFAEALDADGVEDDAGAEEDGPGALGVQDGGREDHSWPSLCERDAEHGSPLGAG